MHIELVFDKVVIVQSILAWVVAPAGFVYSESWMLVILVAIVILISGVFSLVGLYRGKNSKVVRASGSLSILTMTSFNVLFALPFVTIVCGFIFGLLDSPSPG